MKKILLSLIILANFCGFAYAEGMIDENGKILSLPEKSEYHEGLGIVTQRGNNSYGFVNEQGKILIPAIYSRAYDFEDGTSVVSQYNFYGLINKEGKVLLPFKYRNISSSQEGLRAAEAGYKYAVYDVNGKELYNFPEYSIIDIYNEIIILQDGNFKAIADKVGNLLTKFDFLEIYNLHASGLISTMTKDGWGVNNTKGETIIPHKFKNIHYLKNNRILTTSNKNKYSIYTSKGKFIKNLTEEESKLIYKEIDAHVQAQYQGERYTAFEEDGLWGIKDSKGNILTKPKYPRMPQIRGNYIFEDTSRVSYYDNKGNEVIIVKDKSAENIYPFSDGLAKYKANSKYGYIDKTGTTVIKPQFVTAGNFNNGLAVVEYENRKYGIINKKGEYTVKPEFYYIADFSEGLAVAQKEDNDLYGYINETGTFVIPQTLYRAYDFEDGAGKTLANKDDVKYTFLDKNGNKTYNPKNKPIIKDDYTNELNKLAQYAKGDYWLDFGQLIQKLPKDNKQINDFFIKNRNNFKPYGLFYLSDNLISYDTDKAVYWYFIAKLRQQYLDNLSKDMGEKLINTLMQVGGIETENYIKKADKTKMKQIALKAFEDDEKDFPLYSKDKKTYIKSDKTIYEEMKKQLLNEYFN